MINLFIDSSFVKLTVAISRDDLLIDFVSFDAWQCQSEYMIPEIDKLLTKNNLTAKDVGSIYVANGPGSYTGVRIAVSVAKVMGLALSIPIYTLSSLHIIKNGNHPSICLMNARSGRSYIGIYKGDEIILNDSIKTNEDVLELIKKYSDFDLCGDAKHIGLEALETNVAQQMVSLMKIATKVDDVLSLKPIYMKGQS